MAIDALVVARLDTICCSVARIGVMVASICFARAVVMASALTPCPAAATSVARLGV